MSIKPVDYLSTIPKSQQISKVKQIENQKVKSQVGQITLQQEKQIKGNMQKVRDTNKSEGSIIDPNKRNNTKKNKKNKKKKQKRKDNEVDNNLGGNIDIKI